MANKGDTVVEFVTALLEDKVVNEHIEVRLGSKQSVKVYLWKEVKAYKEAKLDEIIESKSLLEHAKDPPEGVVTTDNILKPS